MTLISTFSIALIAVAVGAHLFLRPFLVHARWLTVLAVSGLAALLSYYTALQYFTWMSGGSVARLLLPPHQGIGYFAFYSFTEFWANHLLAAAIGFVGFLVIHRHARQQDPFFYEEEPLLFFLSFLLVGHPFWIFYVIALLVAVLMGTLATKFITKTNNRVSFRYLWLPLAALTLALSPLLNKLDFVIYLRF